MRSMPDKEIAQELKAAILYREDNEGAVKFIAQELGLTRRTIYAYLDGDIKMSLDFLHAAVLATNGDPDVKKFLEPKGWSLGRDTATLNPSKNWEKELGDISISIGCLHSVVRESLRDSRVDPSERVQVKRAIDGIKKELADIEVLVGDL